jgi:hypothetical protein
MIQDRAAESDYSPIFSTGDGKMKVQVESGDFYRVEMGERRCAVRWLGD